MDVPTREAVRAFQTFRNITVDGIVGAHTMAAFDVALGINATASPGLLRITDSQVLNELIP